MYITAGSRRTRVDGASTCVSDYRRSHVSSSSFVPLIPAADIGQAPARGLAAFVRSGLAPGAVVVLALVPSVVHGTAAGMIAAV